MDTEIHTLPRIEVHSGIPCMFPEPDDYQIHENDPAVRIMTDFTVVAPIKIEPVANIDYALNKMWAVGERLLFVTDYDDNIAGVITSYDIQGEKPVKYSQETGVSHTRIQVGKLMLPLEKVPAFDFEFVQKSVVRHIVSTFRELELPHALVIHTDINTGKQVIRGMFSSTQISKLLGKSVFTPLHAGHSLAEIQHEIEHPTI